MKPSDIIEDIWVRDVVDLTWEIFRWRRLKAKLLADAMVDPLRTILESLSRSGNAGLEIFPDLTLTFQQSPQSPEYKLAKKWAAGDPAAISQVNKRLMAANFTTDTVTVRALVEALDNIERIDRLGTIAEGRRNAVLREIDRRRTTFAQMLHGAVHDIENAEIKTIEHKSIATKGAATKKNAA